MILFTSSSSSRCFLTSMVKWKLCFLLLLPLTVCFGIKDTSVSLVKTIGSEPDVTEICTNSTLQFITLIVCKIRTERNGSEECRLLYQYGKGFEHQCDSRFKLILENQTVFLQLTGLTPVDSGNYTCECSHLRGTFILHLKVTMEENEDTNSPTLKPQTLFQVSWFAVVFILTGVIAVTTVLITGVILEIFYRAKSNGGCTRSATSGLSERETPGYLAEDDPDDPYISLQQPTSDLYQTISNPASNTVTVHLDNLKKGDREFDPSFTVYENI